MMVRTKLVALALALVWTAASPAQTTHESLAPRTADTLDQWTPAPPRPERAPAAGLKHDFGTETRMQLGDQQPLPSERFLSDVRVTDPTYDETEPAMVADNLGALYVAVEQYGPADGWVRIYRSLDSGATWAWFISFTTGESARNPALAYADRPTGERWLYMTYEANYASGSKVVQVIRVNVDDVSEWDAVTVTPILSVSHQIHPRICTDDIHFSSYYVYVTYAVNAIDYYATMFTRSIDDGLTYSTPVEITGGSDNTSFVPQPDITYGEAGLFIAFEKPGSSSAGVQAQVWVTKSDNFGSTWDTPQQLTSSLNGAQRPAITAGNADETVMVAYTYAYSSDTDVRCSYSTDGGATYSSGSLPWTLGDEKGVALTASRSTGYFHAAYWRDHDILYTATDAASPGSWSATALVNEANWASSVYPRPTLCVHPERPTVSEACVAWTDLRGSFYDVYFDAEFIEGACCFADESCAEMSASECADAGGTFVGAGIPCAPDLCDICNFDELAPSAELTLGDFDCVPYAGATPIYGTATDPEGNLANWTLSERAMDSAAWTFVASGNTPVAGGVLVNWSPSSTGYRMLRLVVEDQCGHAATAVRLTHADTGPGATLNYPESGDVIGGSAVCINGLIQHGVCAIDWMVEYCVSPGGCTTLATGTGAVRNLPLTHWDTTSVPDGDYLLRVTAFTVGGNDADTAGVTVDNTAPVVDLSAPINCVWVDGVVEIYGTVSDANLNRWRLQWTGGLSQVWNPIAEGTSNAHGLLATWDVSALPDCSYTIRLSATDTARLNCTNDEHYSETLVTLRVGDPGCPSDLSGDGIVGAPDLNILLSNWGLCD